MHYKPHVEIQTPNGPAFFDPRRVVFVMSENDGARIVLDNNLEVRVSISSEEASKKLWRFANQVNNDAYFNEQHVCAVIPDGSGSKMIFSQGTGLISPVPPALLIEGLRTANANRNAIVGDE